MLRNIELPFLTGFVKPFATRYHPVGGLIPVRSDSSFSYSGAIGTLGALSSAFRANHGLLASFSVSVAGGEIIATCTSDARASCILQPVGDLERNSYAALDPCAEGAWCPGYSRESIG